MTGTGKLSLTRKLGERIRIGADVVVTVTQIQEGRVKLEIEAPLDVTVDREEVFEAKKREREGPR
jgi:carbon storage regulator